MHVSPLVWALTLGGAALFLLLVALFWNLFAAYYVIYTNSGDEAETGIEQLEARLGRDADRRLCSSGAEGRTRHIGTGCPCGPSARGRRRRRGAENP